MHLLLMLILSLFGLEVAGTILKHVYTVKTIGDTRNMAVSGCQLVDLRPDFRNSIVHQLRPYYNSGHLMNANLFWVDLSRASATDQFSWSDGSTQADLSMGDIIHVPRNNDFDNNLCVALKWSNNQKIFILRIEPCSADWFPFCEQKTVLPCDYTRIGNMDVIPDGSYQTHEIPGITSRSSCEDECTRWGDTNLEECWMLTYNSGIQSCRLIIGTVMPHWEETCHWFSYNHAFEAWNRNCIEMKVLDTFGNEIILGPCVLPTPSYIVPEVTSTPMPTSSGTETTVHITLWTEETSFVPESSPPTVFTSVVADKYEVSYAPRITSPVADGSEMSTSTSNVRITPSVFEKDSSSAHSVVSVSSFSVKDMVTTSVADMHMSSSVFTEPSSSLFSAGYVSSVNDVYMSSSVFTEPSSSVSSAASVSSVDDIMSTSVVDERMTSSAFGEPMSPFISHASLTSIMDDEIMSTTATLHSSDSLDTSVSRVTNLMSSEYVGLWTSPRLGSTEGMSVPASDSYSSTFSVTYEETGTPLSVTNESDFTHVTDQSEPITTGQSSAAFNTATTFARTTQGYVWSTTAGSPLEPPITGEDGVCAVVCPCNSTNARRRNDSFINDILESLKINVKNTSAYRRLYTSATDNRPVSVGLGWSGATLLILVGAGIFLLDCQRLFNDTLMLFSNVKEMITR